MSKKVPQDPVSVLMDQRGTEVENEKAYTQLYEELHLDKPNFYFSIIPNYYPDNLNAISNPLQKSMAQSLLNASYRWKDFSQKLSNNKNISFSDITEGLEQQNFYYPRLVWHGVENQYHNWLRAMIGKSPFISIVDGKPVYKKVGNALLWTLSITVPDLIFNLIFGIWIGVFLFKKKDALYGKVLRQVLFVFFTLPVFWLATILVVYFTTDDYGAWTNIFPSVGIDIYPGKPIGYQIFQNSAKLILPILCLTLHTLGYVSRFIERSINDEFKKPYIETAFSKGLTQSEVLNKHALKNSLIPTITVFVGAFSSAFVGSLLLEVVFNIPGLGRLLFNSIQDADWNIVFYIVMILSVVTSVAYLIGDILYKVVNPKIKFDV